MLFSEHPKPENLKASVPEELLETWARILSDATTSDVHIVAKTGSLKT